jgi:hypothetical protein
LRNAKNSLVIEDDVWPPDVVGGYVEHVDTAVFVGVPSHFVIIPELLHPQICGHNLIS